MRMIQEGAHSLDLTGNVKIASSLLTETVPIPSECRLTKIEPNITPKGTGTAALFVVDSGLTFKNGNPRQRDAVPVPTFAERQARQLPPKMCARGDQTQTELDMFGMRECPHADLGQPTGPAKPRPP